MKSLDNFCMTFFTYSQQQEGLEQAVIIAQQRQRPCGGGMLTEIQFVTLVDFITNYMG